MQDPAPFRLRSVSLDTAVMHDPALFRLRSVSLDTAVERNTGGARAGAVEHCNCDSGYTGLSCETCAVGYTRGLSGLYLGECVPCDCNGHSVECDPDTNECMVSTPDIKLELVNLILTY